MFMPGGSEDLLGQRASTQRWMADNIIVLVFGAAILVTGFVLGSYFCMGLGMGCAWYGVSGFFLNNDE